MPEASRKQDPSTGVKMVVIAHPSGAPLVKIRIDECIDEHLVVPFLTAIKTFSKEVIGDSQDMQFQSGGLDLYCLTKEYGGVALMIFALMDREMEKREIKDEAETALDAFVRLYGIDAVRDWDGDADAFRSFEVALQGQIHEYYEKIACDDGLEGAEASRRGFFKRLLDRFRLSR